MDHDPQKSKMAAALIVSKMQPKEHDSGIEGDEPADKGAEEHEHMCGEDIMSAMDAKDPKALARAIKALHSY